MTDVLLISRKTLYRLMEIGDRTGDRMRARGAIGPQEIRLSAGCVRFSLDECRRWIANRKLDGTLANRSEWIAMNPSHRGQAV